MPKRKHDAFLGENPSQKASSQPRRKKPRTLPPSFPPPSVQPQERAIQTDTSTPTLLNRSTERSFSATDLDQLSENEFYRYLPNSSKVGHALLKNDEHGETIALQYPSPAGTTGEETPEIRPLQNIQRTHEYGSDHFIATTPNGTKMCAKRFLNLEAGQNNPEPLTLAYFSPMGEKVFWGSAPQNPMLFRDDLDPDAKADLQAELKELTPHRKGNQETTVQGSDVVVREKKKREKTQNAVMKISAQKSYEAFLELYKEELSAEMRERLERSIDAVLNHPFYGNYRPEWLHALAWSLAPLNSNPQTRANLGAAPKWCNTEMMILERIAKWFALNHPDAIIKIKPLFEMLLDSELIEKINFQLSLEFKGRYLRLFQNIHPFQKYPSFRKASDLAQGALVVYQYLSATPPLSRQEVRSVNSQSTPPSANSSKTSRSLPFSSSTVS